MQKLNYFNLSEKFYSVQCEGITTGVPAYFMRLQSCNLSCGTKNNSKDIGDLLGKEIEGRKCTWVCDTIAVWRQGNKITFDQVLEDWKQEGVLDGILDGVIHIIWTGGEPSLPKHRRAIKAFVDYLRELYPENRIFNEIETNGTLNWDPEGFYFFNHKKKVPGLIDQINCSPKLANSGMEEKFRINPDAINMIQEHPNHWFKFVISTEEDIDEIHQDFVKPFNINRSRIILMPGVDCLADLSERTRFVFEMTKKYGYRGISRSHILSWDRCTGV